VYQIYYQERSKLNTHTLLTKKEIMKKILFFSTIVLLIASCKQAEKTTLSMSGAYKMDEQSYKGPNVDTVIKNAVQVKLYSPTHYVFAVLSNDSTAGFGVGNYEQDGNVLTEHNIFRPNMLDTAMSVKVEISQTENGYSQHIPELKVSGVSYSMDEKYTRVSTASTSDLDGLWEQSKVLTIKGTDTTSMQYKQYKIYQDGYFLFVHQYPNATTGKVSNGFGYGTFKLTGNSLEEKNSLSNYKSLIGVPMNISISLDGKDAYNQTIVDTVQKVTTIEYYKRIK